MGKMRIPLDEYKRLRDLLLNWEWMTEAFDSEKNIAVYKPTRKGSMVYAIIVRSIGEERLVNGYKLDLPDRYIFMPVLLGEDRDYALRQVLIKGNVLTESYDNKHDVTRYELTRYGAKLFIAFFVSLGREVGTLPGDKKAKFFRIMANMPHYSMRFSEIMDNIAKGFQAFDRHYNKGGGFGKMNENTYKPRNNLDIFGSDELKKAGDRMMNFHQSQSPVKKQSKKKKSSKSKKSKNRMSTNPDSVMDYYSHMGKKMMGW